MEEKLIISVLGHRNSGKSETWKKLFGKNLKTGSKLRKLYFNNTEYIEVFLINGSPEERQTSAKEMIGNLSPQIVLCSMQYVDHVSETINYFIDNKYFFYTQWLTPGWKDKNLSAQSDDLEIVQGILSKNSTLSIRNGKTDPTNRVQEIKDFLYGWASSRGLIFKENT